MHPDSDKLLMVTPVCSHGLLYGSVRNQKATGLPVQNLLPWRPHLPVDIFFIFLLPTASEWNPHTRFNRGNQRILRMLGKILAVIIQQIFLNL